MPADPRLQAREILARAAEPLAILYPDLPSLSDLSDQATAKRYEALSDLLIKIKVQGLRTSGQVVVLKGIRRALGESPLDHPAPEPGPGVARLIPRSASVDLAPGEPLDVSISRAWGDDDFEGGVA